MPVTHSKNDSVELSIKSHLQNVSVMSICARSLAEYFGLNAEAVMQLELAVSEAVTNCIEHAYENATNQTIIMRLEKTDDYLQIQILDQGHPIPADKMNIAKDMFDQDEFDPESLLNESGRGLGLIQSMMDAVEVGREDGRNVLTLRKNL